MMGRPRTGGGVRRSEERAKAMGGVPFLLTREALRSLVAGWGPGPHIKTPGRAT
jgi:hypothetical protein